MAKNQADGNPALTWLEEQYKTCCDDRKQLESERDDLAVRLARSEAQLDAIRSILKRETAAQAVAS